jgi:hypothetical protein
MPRKKSGKHTAQKCRMALERTRAFIEEIDPADLSDQAKTWAYEDPVVPFLMGKNEQFLQSQGDGNRALVSIHCLHGESRERKGSSTRFVTGLRPKGPKNGNAVAVQRKGTSTITSSPTTPVKTEKPLDRGALDSFDSWLSVGWSRPSAISTLCRSFPGVRKRIRVDI